jgi:very-short-patch-repair endonuclease
LLRGSSTDAERALWKRLRTRQLAGAKFRRQHPIGPYIADFCCIERRLVVELDGGQHAVAARRDARRTRYLAEQGFRVLRYWDGDVLRNVEGVVEEIMEVLSRTVAHPRSPVRSPTHARK